MQGKGRKKYQVGVVKMLRNNNIVVKENSMEKYSTYFMLDYFDLLFYRDLRGEHKIYDEYWNIRDVDEKKELEYQVAYKTLSLYAGEEQCAELFETPKDARELSDMPFLGIVQINFVHYLYNQEMDGEKALLYCEGKLEEFVRKNGGEEEKLLNYKIYRSSTSGDFCLVIKSAKLNAIFKIATLINNLVIFCEEETFRFNTYTNIGIECVKQEDGSFLTFREATVQQNKECEFALRFTVDNEFAKRLFETAKSKQEEKFHIEVMTGLFGRYDFMLYISMKEFDEIYSILCASKLVGKKERDFIRDFSGEETFLELLQMGIRAGMVKIINERALVSISDALFDFETIEDVSINRFQEVTEKEILFRRAIKRVGNELNGRMSRLQNMESEFVEEWRAFTDITRELSEVINTYVPQGIENDSHVNWQILISDLDVIFDCIKAWNEEHQKLADAADRKDSRVRLLESLRAATDAINQHYKFLQNVNAQTWQSPLYEIQTQIDAEKMMIAYREFLYQYFFNYKELYKKIDKKTDKKNDRRPMIYPIVYPDISADRVYAQLLFPAQKSENSKLLVVKVPSFEYYGRMFDMLPWILHEASHSIRTFSREKRNRYLTETILYSVFSQVLYKLLNHYSNDYGYYKLGALERDILTVMTEAAFKELEASHEDFENMGMNTLEAAVREFLKLFFTQGFFRMEGEESAGNIDAIQRELLSFLGRLDLLDAEINIGDPNEMISTVKAVRDCADKADVLWGLLECIYNAYVERFMEEIPDPAEWKLLLKSSRELEEALQKRVNLFRADKEGFKEGNLEAVIRDYCFRMRDLNRLYFAWNKRKQRQDPVVVHSFWKACIPEIRRKLTEGFADRKGFTELYRILHMVFDNGEATDSEIERVQAEFDILLQEEVENIVEREKTIYRESYADVYMAAALGLDAFGYCRQMFKTISDASIDNWEKESEAVNIHRFRAVAAVLLKKEEEDTEEHAEEIRVSAEPLLEKGEAYCIASIECIKDSVGSKAEDSADMKEFFEEITGDVHTLFEAFGQKDVAIADMLKDSWFEIYLNPKAEPDTEDPDLKEHWKKAQKTVKSVEGDLLEYRHIIHRIAGFITLLALVIGEAERAVVVRKGEYDHLKELYKDHKRNCNDRRNRNLEITKNFCGRVAEYYNNPDSAVKKGHDEMLEDTIEFIQTYYYLNRFEIMSSEEVKKIVHGGSK